MVKYKKKKQKHFFHITFCIFSVSKRELLTFDLNEKTRKNSISLRIFFTDLHKNNVENTNLLEKNILLLSHYFFLSLFHKWPQM